MIIPLDAIDSDTLNNIIEAFILREGTDYGEQEASMLEKIAMVKMQLQQGRAVLVYSELHQNVNILPAKQFNKVPSSSDDY
ncbi:YheU family protein [Thalassotalea hakodatensis]|uniref:YheU family protein n=1 Tax=Thalassotalea hakodatensis TaxID=3030492 RepID=UPI0025737E0C|nr:YheU family protein [Thalassotalea hakodatensis]